MSTTKQYQLPREFAEKWVKALRSGEYKQGIGQLGSRETGYCCIGVAGLICGATDEMYSVEERRASYLWVEGSEYYGRVIIPVQIWEKIPAQLKGTHENNLVAELSEMNDAKEKSFPEIADWIEQNVEFV